MNTIEFKMDHVWIYEHSIGNEMRDVNPTYKELLPWASHYVIDRYICIFDYVLHRSTVLPMLGGALKSL